MNIRESYLNNYPTDEMGVELNENATFPGLLSCLYEGNDVYEFLGVADSLVRERVFEELANRLNESYEFVYNLWLN